MAAKSTIQPAQQAALTPETETVAPAQGAQVAAALTPAPQPAAAPASQQTGSSALVKAGNGHSSPLVLPESGSWVMGIENLEAEDFVLPYIRLTQSVSDDVQSGEAKPGEFRHSITGELLPQPLEFIPLHVSITRARFVDRARLCFSVDGVVGQGDPGGECVKCPYAQWSTDSSGKRIPPQCPKGYQYIVIMPSHKAGDELLPVALILTKTSAPTARRLNYYLRAFRRGSVFELTAVKEKGASGYYYRFEVARKRDLTADEAKAVLQIRQMLAGKQVIVEQEASDFAWEQETDAGSGEDSPF